MSLSSHSRIGRNSLSGSVGLQQINVDLLDKIRLGNLVGYTTKNLFTNETIAVTSNVVSATFDNKLNGNYYITIYAQLAANSGTAGKATQECIIQSSIDGTTYYDVNQPVNIFVDSNNTPIVNTSVYINRRFFRIVWKNNDTSTRVLNMDVEIVKMGL